MEIKGDLHGMSYEAFYILLIIRMNKFSTRNWFSRLNWINMGIHCLYRIYIRSYLVIIAHNMRKMEVTGIWRLEIA